MNARNKHALQNGDSKRGAGRTALLTATALGACLLASQGAAQTIAPPTGTETVIVPVEVYSVQGATAQTTASTFDTSGNHNDLTQAGFLYDTVGITFIDPDGDGYGVKVSITRTPVTQPNSSGGTTIVGYDYTQTEVIEYRSQGPYVGNITGSQITDGSVTGVDVQDGSLTGADIQDGSITQADLGNDSVGSPQIIDNSVTGTDIADGTVTGADIQDGSITQADLGNDSVGSAHIIDNSVASSDIQDGGVQNVDLADDSVDSRTIKNDSILLEDLNSEVTNYISTGNTNTLNQANAYTDQRFNQLDAKVNRNAEIANDGVAMALAAQVPSLANGTTEAFSVGLGHYSGSTAFAMAGTARIENSNWQVFGTLGYGFRAKKLGVSAGVMWSR